LLAIGDGAVWCGAGLGGIQIRDQRQVRCRAGVRQSQRRQRERIFFRWHQ
jgi:hypothetical protein